uniref:protein adenylyltransferase SelO-1, mitochondrial-like n=1 Tax=Styela clava TaxID=7725 RepID=UPI00193AD904|nr:protein adenylyltransferase SelO-1, mitochondrial-like [Styela clava]
MICLQSNRLTSSLKFKNICGIFYNIYPKSAMAQNKLHTNNEDGTLQDLKFDNLALRELPVDTSRVPGSRQVSGACFSLVTPTPVKSPKVVGVSKSALSLLDLSDNAIESKDFAEYFSGNKIMSGSEPASHCYCGHQFGYFSGQLGDGAAMYLGEVVNKSKQRWELQLKGSGLTPYSRTADGRKVLRSSIREFLCSEAIHNLGIPTTRAGSCITSDSRVIRDIFYDGNPKNEQCTVISRIAETFIRFGSFEIFKPTDEETGRAGPSVGQTDLLHKMLKYVSSTFFPDIVERFPDEETKLVEMYREICHKTAKLVAKWQCVGFCHGVLNTDNMSIVGLTIDYGPFGFMERYDPNYVCNGSDDGGRYSYKNQPDICEWNLQKLAEAIKEAVPLAKTTPVQEDYRKVYDAEYISIMRQKLGLYKEGEQDLKLIEDLLKTMEETSADFTNTFRSLSSMSLPGMENFSKSRGETIKLVSSTCFNLQELKTIYKPRMNPQQLQSILALVRENPAFLQIMTGGRMGMIMTEMNNLEKMEKLDDMTEDSLKKENVEKWTKWFDEYEKRLADEASVCNNLVKLNENRIIMMNKTNPAFILRNCVAQNAIEEAENGNYGEVHKLLNLLEHPFDEIHVTKPSTQEIAETSASCQQGVSDDDNQTMQYSLNKTPMWALQLKVT